jgi:hypothetical protein
VNRSSASRSPFSRFRVFLVSRFSAALRRYFRSGWAFLIPYLAAYLLYWWLRWPVNPAFQPFTIYRPVSTCRFTHG